MSPVTTPTTAHADISPSSAVRDALWLGWEVTAAPPFGFAATSVAPRKQRLLRFEQESHLITFAPTGAGKGTGAVIPNLLQYPGTCVVLDLKNGELTRVTARRRRELGQEVVVLDPFAVTGEPSGGLNPFSLFDLAGTQLEADAEVLAENCSRGLNGVKDPFWDQNGTGLLSGVIAHVASLPLAERTFSKIFEILLADDTVYTLAHLLDTHKATVPRMAYREIAAFLQMPDVTRGGVLATTQSYLKGLHSPGVLRVLDRSTFSLGEFVAGKPLTIYIVLPVDRLHSHRAFLKLLVGVLLKAIVSRRARPAHRTLLLIDECAQLGNFPLLETFITLCRSFGCRAWTFWQDLAQLQTHYPTSWRTILNNCGVVQTFGIQNRDLAEQWSGYFDSPPNTLRNLGRDEQVLLIPGRGEVRAKRLNYLRQRRFAGQFDTNPLYEHEVEATPPVIPAPQVATLSTSPAQHPNGGSSTDGPQRRPRSLKSPSQMHPPPPLDEQPESRSDHSATAPSSPRPVQGTRSNFA